MTTITDERLRQSFFFLVSGIIVNDPSGPLRWSEWIDAPDAQSAEEVARTMVASQIVEGRRGVLLVANVFQLGTDGLIQTKDTYAVYSDDPTRAKGFVSTEKPWIPPRGFEGYL